MTSNWRAAKTAAGQHRPLWTEWVTWLKMCHCFGKPPFFFNLLYFPSSNVSLDSVFSKSLIFVDKKRRLSVNGRPKMTENDAFSN